MSILNQILAALDIRKLVIHVEYVTRFIQKPFKVCKIYVLAEGLHSSDKHLRSLLRTLQIRGSKPKLVVPETNDDNIFNLIDDLETGTDYRYSNVDIISVTDFLKDLESENYPDVVFSLKNSIEKTKIKNNIVHTESIHKQCIDHMATVETCREISKKPKLWISLSPVTC